MENHLLSYKNSTIGYYHFGNGPELVLCFHGYGESGKSFAFLEKYLGDKHKFIAIDLPFHGKTDWKQTEDFKSKDLEQIINEILKQNNFKPLSPDIKTTLLGFSLGGRMALSLYELQPETINKLILLAPDGLKVNFWYWLSTQTLPGKKLFHFTMKYPGWFFAFLKTINSLGFVNSSVFKFVSFYIGDKEVRELLYKRWITLRKLKPRISFIKSRITKLNTSIRLIYGKHDRIIIPARGEKFRKGIEQQCNITVIPSGHQVLHEKHAEEITSALLH